MELNIQNVSMTYPNGKQALQDLNLDLKSPSLIGLLGPNGAGKSTLMKLLVAALLPTSGSIQVDGAPLAKAERQLKAQLGYLPQDFGLFDELTVAQFLDYMAALKGLRTAEGRHPNGHSGRQPGGESARPNIRTLSGGQRQRVGIAQALLGDPPFLIFDEPTVGLDPEERIHFRNLFSQAAQDRLVLLSTHIIEDVQSVCDQLVVMNHGQILFTGTPEALIQSAAGHVGVFWEQEAGQEAGLHITARVNTGQGRPVPGGGGHAARPTPSRRSPSLEDAYLYLISPGRRHNENPSPVFSGAGTAAAQPPDLAGSAADSALPGGGTGPLQARRRRHHALHVPGQSGPGRRRGGGHPVRPADGI